MIIHRILLFLLLFSLLATIPELGCRSRKHGKTRGGSNGEAAGKKADKDDDVGPDNIKVFNADGKPILKLKEKDYGYKLYTISGTEPASQQPIAKLKFDGTDVKVEDANGKGLYKFKTKEEDKIKIEDAAGQLLYSMKPKEADFKLEDPNGQLIYRLKQEDYGYKVTDEKDQLLFKIKRSNARIVVESAAGKTTMEVKGLDNPLAVSALALEKLDQQQRTALMILLNRKGKSWQ